MLENSCSVQKREEEGTEQRVTRIWVGLCLVNKLPSARAFDTRQIRLVEGGMAIAILNTFEIVIGTAHKLPENYLGICEIAFGLDFHT